VTPGVLFPIDVERSAVLSTDGRYRYELVRRWDDRPLLTWVMLNPSTADGEQDDPTIRRVMSFTERERIYGGCVVVNLFAYRATSPKDLLAAHRQGVDIAGQRNYEYLRQHIVPGSIAAWGANAYCTGKYDRNQFIAPVHNAIGAATRCLGTTIIGHPRHPLYVRSTQPFTTF